MHTQSTIDQFIEKRAKGAALHRIASEIGVSKTTLVAWSQKYALEISVAQQDIGLGLHARSLQKLERREAELDSAHQRVSPVLKSFDPKNLNIMQAYRLYFLIQRETLRLNGLQLKNHIHAAKLLHPVNKPASKSHSAKRSSFGQVSVSEPRESHDFPPENQQPQAQQLISYPLLTDPLRPVPTIIPQDILDLMPPSLHNSSSPPKSNCLTRLLTNPTFNFCRGAEALLQA